MKKILFCSITVLLMISVLCLPLFSATGAPAEPYLLGDVDGDGRITSADVTCAQRILAQIQTDPDGLCSLRGDVDGDGKLTAIDVTLIMRYLARMDIPYPINTTIESPTEAETLAPTDEPTQAPATEAVTEAPTEAPTEAVTEAPTVKPTSKPDPYELPPI